MSAASPSAQKPAGTTSFAGSTGFPFGSPAGQTGALGTSFLGAPAASATTTGVAALAPRGNQEQFIRLSHDLRDLALAYAVDEQTANEARARVGEAPQGFGASMAAPVLNEHCKFTAVRYKERELKDHSCPRGMDEKKWEKAINFVFDRGLHTVLSPEPVLGAEQLQKVMHVQQAQITEARGRMEKLVQNVRSLEQRRESESRRVARIRARHHNLAMRQLEVMKRAELLQSISRGLDPEERVLFQELESLLFMLRRKHADLSELKVSEAQASRSVSRVQDIEGRNLEVLLQALERQRDGLEKLAKVLRHDQEVLNQIQEIRGRDGPPGWTLRPGTSGNEGAGDAWKAIESGVGSTSRSRSIVAVHNGGGGGGW